MIDIIVPVLGRPAHAAPVVESFRAARRVESSLMFVALASDLAQARACERLISNDVVVTLIGGDRQPGDFARKINAAYRITTAPFLFQAADDVTFEPGWDEEALRVAEETGAGVIGTNDMANQSVKLGKHSTHSLIRRSYIDECGGSLDGPGVVFHEGYGHQWVDNELVELARSRGCFAAARNSIVRHAHPVWRTAPDDDTYRLGQSTTDHDRALYKERRRRWL